MKEPGQYERTSLEEMTIPELVGVILRQQEWAQQMYEEVEKLKAINNRNSKDSSKPPSSDFLKLSEKAKEVKEEEEEGKKKVGGQKGHKGKTRKGFNRVDRYLDNEMNNFANILNIDSEFIFEYIDWIYKQKDISSEFHDRSNYSFIWRRDDYEKFGLF